MSFDAFGEIIIACGYHIHSPCTGSHGRDRGKASRLVYILYCFISLEQIVLESLLHAKFCKKLYCSSATAHATTAGAANASCCGCTDQWRASTCAQKGSQISDMGTNLRRSGAPHLQWNQPPWWMNCSAFVHALAALLQKKHHQKGLQHQNLYAARVCTWACLRPRKAILVEGASAHTPKPRQAQRIIPCGL